MQSIFARLPNFIGVNIMQSDMFDTVLVPPNWLMYMWPHALNIRQHRAWTLTRIIVTTFDSCARWSESWILSVMSSLKVNLAWIVMQASNIKESNR